MDTPQGGASLPSPKANFAPPGHEGSIVFGSVHEEAINSEIPQQSKLIASANQANKRSETPERKDKPEEMPKVTSKTCKPIAAERPRIELPS